MAVYLAAAVTFGFYLSAVPVKFALILRVADHLGFGAGASVFEGRYALKQARLRARGEKKHLPWRRAELDVEKFSNAADMFRRLIRDTRLEELRASGRIGLPDAARTALVCGFARAAEGALGAALAPGAVCLDLRPDFSGGGCEFAVWGMFSITAGHIILGALSGASELIFRRVREWTGIPLKIS